MPISPSGYDSWNACRLRWWFRYVDRVKIPVKEHLTRGTAIHTAVEGFLLTGEWPWNTDPEILRRAQKGLPYLVGMRLPGWVGVEIETWAEVDLTPYGGVDKLRGRLDWKGRNAVGEGYIIDHKSTAKPSNFLTQESLAESAQLHAYAAAKFPGEDAWLAHIYYPEDPHPGDMVTGKVTWADIQATLAKFAAATVEIAEARRAGKAPEPNTGRCWDYGGCDYAGSCPHAPAALRERNAPTATLTGDYTPMSDLTPEQRRARALLGLDDGATPAPAPSPTPAPTAPTAATPAPSEPLPPEPGEPTTSERIAKEGRDYAADQISKLEAAGIPVPERIREIAEGRRGVNPPDAAPTERGAALAAQLAAEEEEEEERTGLIGDLVAVTATQAAEEPVKRPQRPRGRPRKNPAPAETAHPAPTAPSLTEALAKPGAYSSDAAPLSLECRLSEFAPTLLPFHFPPDGWDVLIHTPGGHVNRYRVAAFGLAPTGLAALSYAPPLQPGRRNAIEDPAGTVVDLVSGDTFESVDAWVDALAAA